MNCFFCSPPPFFFLKGVRTIVTLTWKLEDQVNNLGKWYVNGQLLSPDLLPNNQVAIDALNLTAGQKYYWQGEYVGGLSGIRINIQGGDFYIPQHQPLTNATKTFSSVTVLTPDSNITAGDVTGIDKALAIAKGIASNFDAEGKKDNGTILVYNHANNQWTVPFAILRTYFKQILSLKPFPVLIRIFNSMSGIELTLIK
jgi:hypothetical protein